MSEEEEEEKILKMFVVKNLDTNQVTNLLDLSKKEPKIKYKYIQEERSGHSLTLVEDNIYIFGGNHYNRDILLIYNVHLNQFIPCSTIGGVKSRSFHSSILMKDFIVFYGGLDSGFIFSDIFLLNLHTNKYEFITNLMPSYGHSCNNLDNENILIFGGCDEKSLSKDTLIIFNVKNFKHQEIKKKISPPARHFHSSIVFQDKLYIFGGKRNQSIETDKLLNTEMRFNQYLNDLWVFDGKNWKEIETEKGPRPLFGGFLFLYNNEIHLSDGELENREFQTKIYKFKDNEWETTNYFTRIHGHILNGNIIYQDTIYQFGRNSRVKELLKFNEYSKEDYKNFYLEERQYLLLGAGEVGKSTIFKQLKKIYNEITQEDLNFYTSTVYENIVVSLKKSIPFSFSTNDLIFDFLSQLPDILSEYQLENIYTTQFHEKIVKLSKDLAISKVIHNVEDYKDLYLPDGITYLIENIDRIKPREFYEPNFTEILHSYRKTTGGTTLVCEKENIKYKFIDTGGQRNERKKWHNFYGINVNIVFVVNLCGYNKKCYEDDMTNRLLEDLTLFDEFINSERFKYSNILLLFNKKDKLKKQIEKKDELIDIFPDYKGGRNYKNALKFIIKKFLEKNKGIPKRIKYHIIQATDIFSVLLAFQSNFDLTLDIHLDSFHDVLIRCEN